MVYIVFLHLLQEEERRTPPSKQVILSPERDLAKMYRLFSLAIEICLVFWAICNCKVHFNILIKVSIIHLLIIHNEFEDSDKSAFMAGPWSARETTGSSVVWSSCCSSFLASHLISSWICALSYYIWFLPHILLYVYIIEKDCWWHLHNKELPFCKLGLFFLSHPESKAIFWRPWIPYHFQTLKVPWRCLLLQMQEKGLLAVFHLFPHHPTTLLKLFFMYFLNFPFSLYGFT